MQKVTLLEEKLPVLHITKRSFAMAGKIFQGLATAHTKEIGLTSFLSSGGFMG
jgi:hypothetical protein